MKKVFLPAMLISAVVLLACNDQSTADNNTTDTPATETTTSATSNVMTKMLTLTSAEEVPPNTSTGTGTADVTYNKDNKMLTYKLSWSGLTGEPTMAHIHGTSPKGANSGPRRDLTPYLQKSASGSFSDSVMVDGKEIKEDSLLLGFYYFNIHTAAHPGGEIRAQIEF